MFMEYIVQFFNWNVMEEMLKTSQKNEFTEEKLRIVLQYSTRVKDVHWELHLIYKRIRDGGFKLNCNLEALMQWGRFWWRSPRFLVDMDTTSR